MIRRLQWKFIAIAMLSLVLVLLVMIGSINVLNYRNLVIEAEETLQLLARNGGKFPSKMGFREDIVPPKEQEGNREKPGKEKDFSVELAFQSRFFTATFQQDGTICSTNLDNIASIDEQTAQQLAASVFEESRNSGFSGLYRFWRETKSNGQTLLIFLSCERELSTFRNFLLVSIAISAVGILAVFLLITLFSGRIVRPIAQSYEKQKQFITDAGHELKTPITIINADVDVLETEIESNEWLCDIRLQTHRLGDLTNDLIYLSKMEEEHVRSSMIEFPLSDVAGECVQSFSAVAISSGKDFSYSIQPMLTMRGDEKAIRKLISILMDNAMKYSSENGKIRFGLEKSGRLIQLSVYNTADHISRGNNDRLFDRFYRADSSHNSETGGFGLGLAVAKAVAEAHKGKIHATSTDGASLLIEVSLPDTF